jgi:hypothetical protein
VNYGTVTSGQDQAVLVCQFSRFFVVRGYKTQGLFAASGICRARRQRIRMLAWYRGGGLLTSMPTPSTLPAWLTAADVDFYANEFARTGFRGGLNWYRNIDRNWELMAPFAGSKVPVPALYMAGDRDLVVGFRIVSQ